MAAASIRFVGAGASMSRQNSSSDNNTTKAASAMEFEHKVGALDDEDLVVGEKEEKNWKGIVIALLVISSIMAAIIVAIILLTPNGEVDNNRMKLDFDHVLSDQFKVERFNGNWLSPNEIVYVDQNGSIVIFDASTNKSSSMLVKTYDKTLHTSMEGSNFKLSSDRQSILFVSDIRHEFGAPVSARYAIFNISSQTVEFLDDLVRNAKSSPNMMKTPHIQYAAWGPVSNSIIFIESNDIYYVADFAQASSGKSIYRLTKTGASGSGSSGGAGAGQQPAGVDSNQVIINGLPDALYRQTIFSEPNQATLWWSPDGRYLAYLSFNDTQVEATPIEYYDTYLSESNNNPKIHYERYPRAGELNPQVSVHVVDLYALTLAGGESSAEYSSEIQAPIEFLKQQQLDPRLGYYVTYVEWLVNQPSSKASTTNQMLVMWSNRAQNQTILSLCESQPTSSSSRSRKSSIFGGDDNESAAGDWKCEQVCSLNQRLPAPSSQGKLTILPAFNSGQRLIFFALPRPDTLIGDHYHIAMLRGDERAPKYLTHGQFDVDRLISYDPATDSLYFEVKISDEAERHLYKISQVTVPAARQTKCLTCQLAESCAYNYAHLAPGLAPKYFVHECLGPSIPWTRMRLLDEQSNFKSQLLLNTNKQLEQLVKSKQMPIEKYIAIKTNEQIPYDVHIKLYLPNEIEEEKDKRFPLLIESSEIDKRNVWKTFEMDWGKYLASRKQLIYAKIDCVRTIKPSTRSTYYTGSGTGGAGSGGVGAGTGTGGGASSYMSSSSSGAAGSGVSDQQDQLLLDSPLFNSKDQVDVIKFLVENVDLFPYIDRRRIAIWGPSSSSAYVALATTINDDAKLIQCTIASAPITNWRYMSSHTAEHYLGLPWLESNKLKYERANLLKRSYEFSMRKLLILHGTADEQVHVQHSMQFIKSLTEHHMIGGVIHQMQLYPDVGHALLEQVKKHYYLTLDGFIDRCFYQKPITIKATEWKGKVRPKLY